MTTTKTNIKKGDIVIDLKLGHLLRVKATGSKITTYQCYYGADQQFGKGMNERTESFLKDILVVPSNKFEIAQSVLAEHYMTESNGGKIHMSFHNKGFSERLKDKLESSFQ